MWNIVTDSSCDDIRFEEQREDILYQSVPFYLYTDTERIRGRRQYFRSGDDGGLEEE